MLCILSINIYEAPLHKILHLIISSHHCTSSSTPAKPKTNLGVTVRDHIRHMAWRGCQPSHSSNILWGRGRAKYIIPYWQDQIYYFLLARAWRCVVLCIYMRCRYQHVFRLNFSASDPDSQSDLYSDLRKVSHRVKFHVGRFVLKFHQVSRNHILIQIRVKCSGSEEDLRPTPGGR